MCCDILYLTKYVGYTDDDCIQNPSLNVYILYIYIYIYLFLFI